jgi:ABC-2 type transport system permease protein
MVITCLVAPLALSAILGFAFGHGGATGPVTIGITGASPALVRAAEQATQFPAGVLVRRIPDGTTVTNEVDRGPLDSGVIVSPGPIALSDLMIPMVAPGARHTTGFRVVDRGNSLIGQELAESLAAGVASRLYAGRLVPGSAHDLVALSIASASVGGGGHILNYFAPSIAVVFLFIGSGLGMRGLLLERSAGTLVRMAAAPVRPLTIVLGKLAAIFITGLTSILVVWAVTTLAFGADWGAPAGVLAMCVAATLAMCGLGVLLTSLARNEREAFGVSVMVGLVLALLGGNLLPPGSLPEFFQVLSLGTPNGWALVGFGRLSLLGVPLSGVVGPILVLGFIAVVTFGLALPRVRRMVAP